MLGNHGRFITKAIFTPLARVLARLGVTPNMVTVAGTVATVVIAVLCLPQGWIWQGAIGLAIVMFGDSVDGTLARMTTGGTRFGAFLFCYRNVDVRFPWRKLESDGSCTIRSRLETAVCRRF